MPKITYRRVTVSGPEIFYREAGPPNAPTILLLHGFPTASHMFRDLMPRLADHFRMIAPDLPGFGQSAMPTDGRFQYTFECLAWTMARFTEALKLDRYGVRGALQSRARCYARRETRSIRLGLCPGVRGRATSSAPQARPAASRRWT